MTEARTAGYWLNTLSKLVGGQAVVQALNLVTAVLLLRLLPLSEYGLFVAANALVVLASVNSDLGLSMGFTAFGTRRLDDPPRFETLYRAVQFLRRRLFAVVAVALLVAAPILLHRQTAHLPNLSALGISLIYALLTLSIAWAQLNANLRMAVLNMRHDAASLNKCTIIGAAARLVLTVILCSLWPSSIAAVIAVLISTGMMAASLRRYVQAPSKHSSSSIEDDKQQLWTFVTPLIVSTVYFTFQGQLSVLLTTLFAPNSAVAEVGALSRLGQVIVFFNIFYNFLFQPMFARINDRQTFIVSTLKMLGLISAVALPALASAVFFPGVWLLLLGPHYSGLGSEIVLALATPITNYYIGFVYVILSARGFTKGQWLYVVVSITIQAIFLSLYGMDSTHKALLLGLFTALATALLQFTLLIRLLNDWR